MRCSNVAIDDHGNVVLWCGRLGPVQ